MTRPCWDFHYAPVGAAVVDDGKPALDLLVATETDVDPALIAGTLASVGNDVAIEPLLSLHPLYWTRIRASTPVDRAELQRRVEGIGVRVRYIASCRHGSMTPAPLLDLTSARPRCPSRWKCRESVTYEDPRTPGRWFLGDDGVAVDRAVCGTGAGTRLAVIDNDAGSTDRLQLDAEVLVGVSEAPRGSQHGALLAAWAAGAYPDGKPSRFVAGVAPSASVRLYVIPKPGSDVFTLPLAIVRAVDDGADVVVCATYIEGQSSPMLDDALEFSRCLGRAGRGAAVVFPTGREIASAAGSVHASLSLALGDPACDPRVFCVGPSGRDGGWFLWRDRRGRLHPFANRGPSIHWMAPGDDLAFPFSSVERLTHAESSGASGLAAGVLLLVLGINPHLELSELAALVTRTATRVPLPGPSEHADVADPQDVLPYGRDPDGHDAKHGYGRLHATRACLAAADPFSQALINVGEETAARRWSALRQRESTAARGYSNQLAARAASALLGDAGLLHAACVIARHARLVANHRDRRSAHYDGALLRQLAVFGRSLIGDIQTDAPEELATEILDLVNLMSSVSRSESQGMESAIYSLVEELWATRRERDVSLTPIEQASPSSRRIFHESAGSSWKTA
jgi:hypothetical protein